MTQVYNIIWTLILGRWLDDIFVRQTQVSFHLYEILVALFQSGLDIRLFFVYGGTCCICFIHNLWACSSLTNLHLVMFAHNSQPYVARGKTVDLHILKVEHGCSSTITHNHTWHEVKQLTCIFWQMSMGVAHLGTNQYWLRPLSYRVNCDKHSQSQTQFEIFVTCHP